MATQTSAVVQNENIHVPRGKGIEGVKADLLKPEKKERKDRKALADLSKPAKPSGSTALKGSTLKQRSSLHGSETTKRAPKNGRLTDEEIKECYEWAKEGIEKVYFTGNAKSSILTDEEKKKCYEWAKEGIEKVYFTGNDVQKHEKDAIEKRVKKKVDMVMSSMSKWNQVFYDYVTPVKKIAVDIGDLKRLEPEPEVHLPVASLSPTSGFDEGECPILEEPEILWPSYEHRFELRLKEDYKGDASF